jgi:hypothetical protein
LPDVSKQVQDVSLPLPSAPAAAGTRFSLDDRGLVSPSAAGTMNPDGVSVFTGPPPARPPADALAPEGARVDERFNGLAEFRPRARPSDLQEQTERATLAGLTRAELAEYRPRPRPQSEPERASDASNGGSAAQAASLANTGTPQATASSLRPDARPANFSEIVASSRGSIGSVASTASAPRVQTASVAPRRVAPPIPSTASTAREATVENAINLRRINLIGVYGKPTNRKAVVRLSNGRFKNVQVGDQIDGGRISAIGDGELRYQKSGRNHVLKMPSG